MYHLYIDYKIFQGIVLYGKSTLGRVKMTTVIQEVRPLTAQEAHERVQYQRQHDIKQALKPGKWWRFGGWCLSGLFLVTGYLVLELSSTYYEWWHTAPFELHWFSVLVLALIMLLPALLALMCFGMSTSVTTAARTEFLELNLAAVVETAMYRYVTGTKDNFLRNKGCFSLAQALQKEEDEATAVLGQMEKLLEELLQHLDTNGGLMRLSEKRELLSAVNQIIDFMVEQKMEEPAPSEVGEEVHTLVEKLRSMTAANQLPAE